LDWWALVSPNLLIRIAKPTFQIAVFRALFAFSLSIADLFLAHSLSGSFTG
jgi:hypothetical protein